MKKLSIVIPVYFNEMNLPETISHLLDLKKSLTNYQLELIFVDDGSKDKSLDIILRHKSLYTENIRVVKLTRNFGSMAAVQAGLTHATGDCVGVISADLQDPPELFIDMIKHWENGNKVVFAVRKNREDSLKEKVFASMFYYLLRKFALPGYPKGGFDFFLIDKQIVKKINEINEKNTNIMNLIFWLGYDHVVIPYVRKARKKGQSRWTISKKIKLFIDSFVSFSYFPIRILSMFGLLVALSSFIYGIIVFINWWQGKIDVDGWTTLMIVLTFTGGIQMMMLGILGEYVWRGFDETRKRPNYIIDKIYDENNA